MKFRFCGNIEPPDWIQSSVPIVASKSAEDLASFTKCALNKLGGENIVPSLSSEDDDDTMTMVAWISFVLEHASKYDISATDLQTELLQLGLLHEHTTVISKIFISARGSIRESLVSKRFQFAKLSRLKLIAEKNPGTGGSTSSEFDGRVRMSLDFTEKCDKLLLEERIECGIDADKFLALYKHLLQVQETVSEVSERAEAE